MDIRPTRHGDIPALRKVLDGTALFPSEMLPDMMQAFLSGDDAQVWLTCDAGAGPVGFCYAAAETLAEGTWNMLAIAVRPDMQGRGCGGAIVRHLEALLEARRARILIAETSGTAAYARTRAFYDANGYAEEARIRDFWAAGEDKVVFRKALS